MLPLQSVVKLHLHGKARSFGLFPQMSKARSSLINVSFPSSAVFTYIPQYDDLVPRQDPGETAENSPTPWLSGLPLNKSPFPAIAVLWPHGYIFSRQENNPSFTSGKKASASNPCYAALAKPAGSRQFPLFFFHVWDHFSIVLMVGFQYWINSFPSGGSRNLSPLKIRSEGLNKRFHFVQYPLIWASNTSFLLPGPRSPQGQERVHMGDVKVGGKCVRRRSTCGNLSPIFCLVFLQLEFTLQLSTSKQMGMFIVRVYSDSARMTF